MRTQLLIAALILVFVPSCAETSDKDRIIRSNLDIITQENMSWRTDLTQYNAKIDEDQTELRRRFFSNYSTSHNVYLHVSTIAQYFNYSDDILIEYSLLLEEREELIAPLFNCTNLSKDSIAKLITVEDKIIETLKFLKRSK